jgi:subtilisin family serine protease
VTGDHVISLAKYAGRTGRGVRIAVIDSGIHAGHPHVGAVSAGIAVDAEGQPAGGTDDRLGHGTAVAAAIREKAPEAALIPVKVFDATLTTTAKALAAAMEWAAAQRVALINLSLGTSTPDHAPALDAAVRHASGQGAVVVAAAPQGGTVWLPGALPGVVAVEADWTCARDVFAVRALAGDRVLIRASGYPRPIAGVPVDRNFRGPSFAVANATGLIALAIEGETTGSLSDVARAFGQA